MIKLKDLLSEGKLTEGSLKQAMQQWKYIEKGLKPKQKKLVQKALKRLKPKMDKNFKNKDYQDYIDGELDIKVPLPDLIFGKGKEFAQLITAYSNAIKEPAFYEGKLTEAISGSDRKILFILIREIVRNLKSKIKNFDVNNKSHLNRVGSSILAIIRAMSYSPDNVNYKNFKKYFPKGFNSKLIQKKLKQFHSQNDKVQVTLVTQAIKNELGAGVKEGKLTEQKFKKVILPNDMKTKVKVSKIIKKMKLKIDKDYDVKALKARGGDQELLLLPKHYNKFIELAMKNKLNPRG